MGELVASVHTLRTWVLCRGKYGKVATWKRLLKQGYNIMSGTFLNGQEVISSHVSEVTWLWGVTVTPLIRRRGSKSAMGMLASYRWLITWACVRHCCHRLLLLRLFQHFLSSFDISQLKGGVISHTKYFCLIVQCHAIEIIQLSNYKVTSKIREGTRNSNPNEWKNLHLVIS